MSAPANVATPTTSTGSGMFDATPSRKKTVGVMISAYVHSMHCQSGPTMSCAGKRERLRPKRSVCLPTVVHAWQRSVRVRPSVSTRRRPPLTSIGLADV